MESIYPIKWLSKNYRQTNYIWNKCIWTIIEKEKRVLTIVRPHHFCFYKAFSSHSYSKKYQLRIESLLFDCILIMNFARPFAWSDFSINKHLRFYINFAFIFSIDFFISSFPHMIVAIHWFYPSGHPMWISSFLKRKKFAKKAQWPKPLQIRKNRIKSTEFGCWDIGKYQ